MYTPGQVLKVTGGYYASLMYCIVVSDSATELVTDMPDVGKKRIWNKHSIEWMTLHHKRFIPVKGTWDDYKDKSLEFTTDEEKRNYYKNH